MDVFLPLKQIFNKLNPLDRLTALESKSANTASEIVDNLGELTTRTGDMVVDNLFTPADGVEVTDPTDSTYTGGFQSSAGWTFNGVIYQFGAVLLGGNLALDFNNLGQFLAACGNLLIDFRGIVLSQAHIIAQLSANSNYPATYVDDVYFGGFHVLGVSASANGQMRFGHLSLMRFGGTIVSNGSFTGGTTTSWTTTGSPTTVNDSPDGTTYAISVDNSNYVSQTLTTVSGDDYVLTFYVKHVSGLDVGQMKVGASNINLLGADQTATNSWIKVVILFRAVAGTTTIRPYSRLATGAVWYYTGIDCQRLDSWSYVGDSNSDKLGNLEIQSHRRITIDANNNGGVFSPLVLLRNALTQTYQSTPATPSAGNAAIYFKSDDKAYTLNSSGAEKAIATESYVDASLNNYDIKLAVRAASQGNLAFTRAANIYTATSLGVLLKATIDGGWSAGAALAVGDRILLANQTSGVDNGIVTITSLGTIGTNAVLTRSTDADASSEITSEMRVPVSEGTDANIDYKLSAPGPFTLNTTALPFSRAGGPPTGAAGGDLAGTYPSPTITNAAVIAKVLTGFSSGVGTVGASDSVLSAFQKDVANLAAAISSFNGGWAEVTDTWAYASASTITVPTDATTVYQKGDYLRWKQGGGYLYGTIASLTATVITIIVNTDYVVANSAITNVAYSRVANPYGFPEWFNWSPTITGFTATLPASVSYKYITQGRLCTAVVRQQVAGTSNLNTFTITSPVVAATVTNGSWQAVTGAATDNGTALATPALAIIASAGTIFTLTKDLAGAAWTNANGKRANFTIVYEF